MAMVGNRTLQVGAIRWMHAAQPRLRARADRMVVIAEHSFPTRGIVDRIGRQIPIPQAIVGRLCGQCIALFASANALDQFALALIGRTQRFLLFTQDSLLCGERTQKRGALQGNAKQAGPDKHIFNRELFRKRRADAQEPPLAAGGPNWQHKHAIRPIGMCRWREDFIWRIQCCSVAGSPRGVSAHRLRHPPVTPVWASHASAGAAAMSAPSKCMLIVWLLSTEFWR